MSVSALRPARAALWRPLMGWLSGRAPVVAFAFAGAIGLAGLALPRFGAQAVLLPIEATLEDLQIGTALAPVALMKAEQALSLAHRLDAGDGRIATDLALVELIEADRAASPQRAAYLGSAIGHLEDGLSRVPANSFAWARLAAAYSARDRAPSSAMLSALRMSYMTGLYADKIMPFRAGLALGDWDALDAGLKAYAKRELIYLWERRGTFEANQLALMRTLCRTGRVSVLAEALIEGHRATAEFDKLFPIYLTPQGCAAKFAGEAR